ncbi:hypothetical protein IP69_08160 [Bosea sp. AAP35]|nr:hypothetical protein IP69_08160 [Bosea sp. AAP35]
MTMPTGTSTNDLRGHRPGVTRTARGASSAKADTAFGQIDDVRLTDPATDTCPVVQAFMEAWREGLPEMERRILVPLMVEVARSRDTPRRFMMASTIERPSPLPLVRRSFFHRATFSGELVSR